MSTKLVKPVRHGDVIDLEIVSLAFGGESVGRFRDFAVFVPGGLPGERAKVRITQVKDNYATGEILSLSQHSPDRVTPPCSIFEECGGCQWQHFNYPKQLQTKRQFVMDALSRIGRLKNIMVQPCLPSARPYAYRNKALPVLSMRNGHFVSGIYEPRSHKLVPYQTCPIQNDPLNDLIQKVLKKIDLAGLTPFQEKKHVGFLRNLAVRHGEKTGELLLAFVTRTETPEELVQKPTHLPEALHEILPRIASELMKEVPGLVGVLQNINPSRTNVVFGQSTRVLEGRDYYNEIIDGLTLKVSLKSFLQVNTSQAEILHAIVREALGQPAHQKKWGTVLDLYSGIGTLGLAVADMADYVVGVEEVGPAVEDAKVNAQLNHKTHMDYLEGDVASVLLGLRDKGLQQIDAAILDPPRKGVLPEVLARVTAFHPERLVYVSCDPSTLARDLSLLNKHGYEVDWIQPLDMFPQTYHVEAVARLTRETPLPHEVALQLPGQKAEPFRLSNPEGVSLNMSTLRENFSQVLGGLSQSLKALLAMGFSFLRLSRQSLGKGLVALGEGLNRAGSSLRDGFKEGSQVSADFLRKAGAMIEKNSFPEIGSKNPGLGNAPLPLERLVEFQSVDVNEEISEWETIPPAEERPLEEVTVADFSLAGTSEPVSALETIIPEISTSENAFIEEVPVEKISNGGKTAEKANPEPVFEEKQPVPVMPMEKEKTKSAELTSFADSTSPSFGPLPKEMFKKRISIAWAGVVSKLNSPLPTFSLTGPQRTVTAIFLAAFLVGGGYIAMATLSPPNSKPLIQLSGIPQTIPDIIAVMPTRTFLRYEMVPFEVRVNDKDLPNMARMKAVVEVYQGGRPVTMVDGRLKLYLQKMDFRSKRITGNWPIPYNPAPGTYIAQVVVTGPQLPAPKVFQSAFTIPPLKPQGLFPGYCALTMEGGKQLINGAVPSLDGKSRMSSANAIEWAKFMGANVYCYLMGQTSIWNHLIPKDFPFNKGDMEIGRRYARAAHEAGVKFAGYMTTFKVVGDGWAEAPYDFSLGYDLDNDQVVKTNFISINDPKRRQDVTNFLREMDKEPDVDMIGLDYVRTGYAGYEMVDEFVRDLNVPGPQNYWSLSKEDRIHWLAQAVELRGKKRESREVAALFDWWRAHKVALALKNILEEAKVSKPVFTFTLGWEMGHQHGQDPAMFVDAGINYNHIMLYEGTRDHLKSMNQQWPDYLSRGNGMYAMGEMVDFNWVQKSINPPGPQELYNREVETFESWFSENAKLGMFWHDLYRIVYGIRGPYSGMEWTVAGGKAFSTLQQKQGMLPIQVELSAPKDAPTGVPVPVSAEVKNLSPVDLKGLVLHQIDPTKNYFSELATVGPFDLPAGNLVRVKSLYTTLPREDHPERDNRYMVAVLVEKPGESLRAFDFIYVRSLSAGAVLKRMDVSQPNSKTEASSDDSTVK